MELLNTLDKTALSAEKARRGAGNPGTAVLLLAPIVPHVTDALWGELRPGTHVEAQRWPAVDASALVQDEIELMVVGQRQTARQHHRGQATPTAQ